MFGNHQRVALAASSGRQQSTKSTTPGRSGDDISSAPPAIARRPVVSGFRSVCLRLMPLIYFSRFGINTPEAHRCSSGFAYPRSRAFHDERRQKKNGSFSGVRSTKVPSTTFTLESRHDGQWMEAVENRARRKQHRKK